MSDKRPQEFCIGDIVRLKSGGPAMTVTRELPLPRVICDWFSEGKHASADLPIAAIDAATADPSHRVDEASEPLTMRERELRPASVEEAMSRRHAAVAEGRTQHCHLCGAPLNSWIHGPVKAP